MKKTICIPLISSLTVGLLGMSSLAGAVDFGFQPRAEVGFQYYKYEQTPGAFTSPLFTANGQQALVTNRSAEKYHLEDFLPTLGLGLTFFVDRFFVDVSGQRSFSGHDDDTQAFSTFDENTLTFRAAESAFKADFDRSEYAISAGYSVTDHFAVFVGYKWAETDIDFRTTQDQIFDDLTLLQRTIFKVSQKENYNITEKGPFVGATYGWDIKQGPLDGVLSANFAVAFLDSRLKDKISNFVFTQTFPTQGTPTTGSNLRGSADGDTVGITVGLTWRGFTPVKGLTYLVGVQGYSYDFNSDQTIGEFKETAINVKGGVAYSF